jgi:hypothetical protein
MSKFENFIGLWRAFFQSKALEYLKKAPTSIII